MSHEELVERAAQWLANSRRCNVVLTENASCREVPDAIGWSTAWKHRGSIVVECKTSVSDFHADRKKFTEYKHPEFGFSYSAKRLSAKEANAGNYSTVELPRMGRWRYYMTLPGVLTPELLEKHADDHGLLVVEGRRVKIVREATERVTPNFDAEIRLLQFALVHVEENLLRKGCVVNMRRLMKFNGAGGIELRAERQNS